MIYQLIGFILFLMGFVHLFNKIYKIEQNVIIQVQTLINKKPLIGFFQEIWFLGRTIFVFIIITLMILYDWKSGLVADVVLLITIGIENLIKMVFKRARPYQAIPSVSMLQLKEPTDTSFPSGDTLRIWYLALIIPAAFGSSVYLLLGLSMLALLVSFGRIAMGVHHPTDVLTGAGLGIIGAGTTIWLWHLLSLL